MAFVLLDLKKKFYSQYAYYENPVSFWSSSLFHHSIPSQRWTQFSMMCHDATFSDHVIIVFFLLLLSRITLKLCPKQRSAHVPYLTPWPQRFDYAMTAPSLTQRCPGQRRGKAKCKYLFEFVNFVKFE